MDALATADASRPGHPMRMALNRRPMESAVDCDFWLTKSEMCAMLFLLAESTSPNRRPAEERRMKSGFETFCAQPETSAGFFYFNRP
jgi:hypothetical protein